MTAISRPETEIATIILKPGLDISNPSVPEGQAWAEALEIIAAQDGYQQSYYGRQLESPDTLMWLIDWESEASHMKFRHSPSYSQFKQNMATLFNLAPETHHFLPANFPPKILSTAPCTELATFYGTSPTFLQNVEKFAQVLEDGQPDGYCGSTFGSVVEDLAKKGSSEGEKGRAIVLCIGWLSKEHHFRFRDESPLFRDNIYLLRDGNSGAEVVHVAFKGTS